MIRIILFSLLSVFSLLAQAKIEVQVDPPHISSAETFRLILIQEGQERSGVPDLTPLQNNFTIVGTERQVNYTIVNGQSQLTNQWVITLKARHTGILTIPKIKMGTETTDPITVNVETSTRQEEAISLDQQQEVSLYAEANPQKVYVNQQIIYTVRLYNSKRLIDADYQGPKVNDALVIPMGDAKRYQTVKNNTNYLVEEQKYAVFPQKSGRLKIRSPIFNAMIYEINPRRIQAQDKDSLITVTPIPAQYQAINWLPAQSVTFSDEYEHSGQTINQGGTITRVVKLKAAGLPAELLPALQFASVDELSVYPEKGAVQNEVIKGQVIGSTEFKITYLFNKAGRVTIPELRLPWFNTKTGKEEVAVLAPRSFVINPSDLAKNSSSKPAANQKTSTPSQQLPKETDSSSGQSHWPWVLAALFALAWFFTLFLWAWQKRTTHQPRGQNKTALQKLTKACNQSNPSQARDALLQWASLQWPDASLLNLTDLTQLTRDPQLKKQVQILSQALYRTEERMLWQGDALLAAVMGLKQNKPSKKNKAKILPPINPL